MVFNSKASIGVDKIVIIIIVSFIVVLLTWGIAYARIPSRVMNLLPNFWSNNPSEGLSNSPSAIIHFGFKTRTFADVEGAIKYAKSNSIVDRKCVCGDDCDKYVGYIIKYSKENKIPDPLFLLSLMMQESQCKNDVFSGSSVGLMQINLIHCGNYGLPKNTEKCKEDLVNNPEENIKVGAKILREKYNSYGIDSKRENYKQQIEHYCSNKKYSDKYLSYHGWSSALRAYNGFGCSKSADINYVEKIIKRFNQLSNLENGK